MKPTYDVLVSLASSFYNNYNNNNNNNNNNINNNNNNNKNNNIFSFTKFSRLCNPRSQNYNPIFK